MARVDLTEANGWIPEEFGSEIIEVIGQNSVVESLGRREPMSTRTKSVPRFVGDDPVVVAEGAQIPEASATLDEVVLTAIKWSKIFNVSEEDLNDSLADVLEAYKRGFATNFARKFDHAALGVTAAGAGTDAAPYGSVYYNVSQAADVATRRVQTAGDMTFEDVNNAVALVEQSKYFDPAKTAVVAAPSMIGLLRNLKDAAGERVVVEPLAGTPGSLMGYPLVLSHGAVSAAAASSAPSGNGLLIVCGNTDHLINGVRSEFESVVSREHAFDYDGVHLKVRARRGFAAASTEAFAIVEKTDA